MALNDQEESEWAGMLALYEKGVAIALDEIDKGRPQDAADALRQAEQEVHGRTDVSMGEKVPPSICGDPNQTRADRWGAPMDEDQKKRLGKAAGAGIEVPDYMADSWREAENVSVFPDPVDRATAIVNSALWDAREQEPDATSTRIARRVAMYLDASGALDD